MNRSASTLGHQKRERSGGNRWIAKNLGERDGGATRKRWGGVAGGCINRRGANRAKREIGEGAKFRGTRHGVACSCFPSRSRIAAAHGKAKPIHGFRIRYGEPRQQGMLVHYSRRGYLNIGIYPLLWKRYFPDFGSFKKIYIYNQDNNQNKV